MKINKKTGIYCIENTKNNKKYIGRTIDIEKRINEHFRSLKNKKDSKYLQNSFDKYGQEFFIFYIIEECNKEDLNKREIYYVNLYKTNNSNYGYNLTNGGGGILGFKHSQESKVKMSNSSMGKIIFEKQRQKARERLKTETEILKNRYKHIGRRFVNNPSSKYVGVYLRKDRNKNKWRSHIKIDGKFFHIGDFYTEQEAAMAYNEIALECYGWRAKLNNISEEEIKSIWELE